MKRETYSRVRGVDGPWCGRDCCEHVEVTCASARRPRTPHRLPDGGGHPARRRGPLPDSLWFDASAAATLTVEDGRFTDGLGREVVLRGYNVSGETKLKENNGLPFASVADAKKSATALRALGGGNSVRFLLSWAYAEPVRGQVDTTYLAAATAQMRAFLDAGIRVYPDFHQDLYSR